MKVMETNTINMKKFGTSLNTRALADNIFSKEEEGSSIIVDFSGVIDASPSFCHEMLSVLKKKQTHIRFANVNPTIQTQIRKANSM